MSNNVKYVNIILDEANIDYVCFGHGKKYLIIIPGVGDGLKSVRGLANYYAHKYKAFSKNYKIYIISRRRDIPASFTIKDMALDIANLLMNLNIEQTSIIGISQGGMIAQELAITYPELVTNLVLIVTAPKLNDTMESTLNTWLKMLEHKDYKGLLKDTAIKSFAGKNASKYIKVFELSNKIINKKNYLNYEVLLNACLKFNRLKDLKDIKARTLIIGAKLDQVLGYEGSILLNKNIQNSKLVLFDDYSHGVYDQVTNFNDQIKDFLEGEKNE